MQADVDLEGDPQAEISRAGEARVLLEPRHAVDEPGAGGSLSLRARRSGDAMTFALEAPSSSTIEEVVLDTTSFSADAVHGGGTHTLRLQKTVMIENDGDSGRNAEVTVDLVVDITVEK